jgi:hypothetical protein
MAGDVHPWTGLPLESWQTLVIGPDFTGPRVTVVDVRSGARLEPWIERVDVPIRSGVNVTTFADTGEPGGTYQPQQLPDLVATSEQWPALLVVVALAAIGFKAWQRGQRRGGRRRDW